MRRARACLIAATLVVAGCRPTLVWTGRSADRRHTLTVEQDGGRQWIVLDGRRRAAYPAVAAWSVATSADRFVYAARRGRGWTVIDHGRPGPTWRGVGELVVAGARTAYSAEGADGWHVVVDGVAGPAWDAILARTLRFSTDGRHHAYVATRAGASHVVIDGQVGPAWDGVGQLVLAADAAHVAYAARRGSSTMVIVDGQLGPPMRAIARLTLAGDRAVYAGRDADGWHVVDGVVGPAVAEVAALVVRGRHAAWIAHTADGDQLGCDGAVVARVAQALTDGLVVGPDCALAYAHVVDGKVEVVAAGHARRHDEISSLVPSPAGDRLAYAHRDGAAWRLAVDGVDREPHAWASAPTWSDDGRRLGYLARRGAALLVIVDDRRYPFELAIDGTLAFSRDGRHWAVLAGSLAREELFFAVDGTTRVPLALRELYAAAAQAVTTAPLLADQGDVLRQWARAEAERAARP